MNNVFYFIFVYQVQEYDGLGLSQIDVSSNNSSTINIDMVSVAIIEPMLVI